MGWKALLLGAVVVAGLGVAAILARSTLGESFTALGHIRWPWIAVALFAESGSMAAVARVQRRLLRAGGTRVHLGSVLAVTYAGNAISVSLPIAGPEMSTAFTFKQFGRQGIDPAVIGWALAVSGILSSFAFAFVLAAGGLLSNNPAAAAVGLVGAVVSILPAVAVVAALRYEQVRRLLNNLLDWLVRLSRRLIQRPGPGAEGAIERFLDRVSSIRLSRLQYIEVFALAVWNWVADCLCLAAALSAIGVHPPWHGIFLAYGLAMTAGSIGLTPGGLGVIEATLAAALVGVGVGSPHALAAVLVYRLISFWMVMVGGWAVMALLVRRGRTEAATASVP